MSQDGQRHDCVQPIRTRRLEVCTFRMPAGTVFDWHVHEDHQLAWAASGVLTVRSGVEAWVLPPTRALWIPAGVRHETLSEGVATMRTAYVRPSTVFDRVDDVHAGRGVAAGRRAAWVTWRTMTWSPRAGRTPNYCWSISSSRCRPSPSRSGCLRMTARCASPRR